MYTIMSLINHAEIILPINVPKKKGRRGTLITGDAILINQLGRNGVIRRNMM